jgi:hypothetical protein
MKPTRRRIPSIQDYSKTLGKHTQWLQKELTETLEEDKGLGIRKPKKVAKRF